MVDAYDIAAIVHKIETLKQTALSLKQMTGGFTAAERNLERILADVRLLELGISDVAEIL